MKIFYFAILILISNPIFSETTSTNVSQSTGKKTIAVFPFTTRSSYNPITIQKTVEEALLSQELYEVVPSDVVNTVLRKKSDESDAIEFGQANGYDLVVYGKMSSFSSDSRW